MLDWSTTHSSRFSQERRRVAGGATGAIGISRYGRAKRVIFSQKYDARRWLSVVIEIREKRRQHEVITLHFEKEGNINSRERRGLILWRRKGNRQAR